MGWSESYYSDMAAEAGREWEERVEEILEAFRRLRVSAATYGHFHPLIHETSSMVEEWEAKLRELLRGELGRD